MTRSVMTAESISARELTISRLLNAPRKMVWDAWTKPDQIKHWWGPNGFRSSIDTMDVQPGGVWEFVMHGPDGRDYKNKSIYTEVVKYEKLVYDHVVGPAFRFTVTFEEQGEKTLLRIQMLFETAEQKDKIVKEFRADQGLEQNMEKLEMYLGKGYPAEELVLSRLVNASREMVFKAWTDPGMLAKWWGPNGFSSPVCKFEAVAGGAIYIDMTAPDGTKYPMDGEIVEIDPPSRLVFIAAALDEKKERLFENRNELTLTEKNGKTRLQLIVSVMKTRPGAEQPLAGMNEGWSQSLERLINLVE